MDEPSDDDKTPQRRSRPQWGDDRRAAVGREHRASNGNGPDGESRRGRARSPVMGVPIPPGLAEQELGSPGEIDASDITEPWELLDRDELNADELKIVERSKRNSSDPAMYSDVVKLTSRLIKQQLDDRSQEKNAAKQMLALLQHPPHEATAALQRDVAQLQKQSGEMSIDVASLKRWWSPIRAVIVFLAVTALGALGFFVDQIMSHAEQKGETVIRLDHLERAILDLRQDIRDERSSLRYEVPSAGRPTWIAPLPSKDKP